MKNSKKWSFCGNTDPKWALIAGWAAVYMYFPVVWLAVQIEGPTPGSGVRENIWWGYSVVAAIVILTSGIILKSRLLCAISPFILFSYILTFFGVYAPN